MKKNNSPVITFDTDWCPDFMIEPVCDILESFNVKSTWFITNNSKILDKKKDNRLYEIGIHPNFNTGSSHGSSYDEIMTNVIKFTENPVSSRSHYLFMNKEVEEKLKKNGIKYEGSSLMNLEENIRPDERNELTIVPIYWMDDLALQGKSALTIKDMKLDSKGLKVFDFHPVYIYLNSKDKKTYEIIRSNIQYMKKPDVDKLINNETYGIKDLFCDLIEIASKQETFTISEIGKNYV